MAAPMYRVIAEQLRQQIEDREFEAGKQLPTEQELQERYGASRNTIRDAIKQLITLGLVETRPGQGTFVVPPIDPFVTTLTGDPTEGGGGGEGTSYASEVEKADRKPSVSKIKVEIQAASEEVAAACGYRLALRSSAGTANDTSTGRPGPWRRRSTRASSRTAAPRSSARLATSTKERSGTCRIRSASAKSATGTGFPCGRRMRAKWTTSRCRQMAGWPWWKIRAPHLMATSDPCV